MHLSLSETNAVLNKIKAIDLKTADRDTINNLIIELNKHLSIVSNLPVGRVIIRTVSCNYLKDNPVSIYPLTLEQLSFNPNFASCGFNRASWEGQSVFYGSISTDNLQPYYTSSFEVLADLNDSENEIDKETFVIGKWVVKKEIPLIHISGKLKNNANVASSRYDALYKSLSQYPESMISLKMIDSYLCEEFKKDVSPHEKWKYKISAAYSDFIKNDNWPGIIYPSLKSEGAGYNVALFPDNIYEYIVFERAALTTYYKRGKNLANEILMEALADGNNLRWKETYDYKLTPAMKRWYTGRSNDMSFQNYIKYTGL